MKWPEKYKENMKLNYTVLLGYAFLTFFYLGSGFLGCLFAGYHFDRENRMTNYGIFKAIVLPKRWRKFFFYSDKKNGIFSAALVIEVLGYINLFMLLFAKIFFIRSFQTFRLLWAISHLIIFALLGVMDIIIHIHKRKHRSAK